MTSVFQSGYIKKTFSHQFYYNLLKDIKIYPKLHSNLSRLKVDSDRTGYETDGMGLSEPFLHQKIDFLTYGRLFRHIISTIS